MLNLELKGLSEAPQILTALNSQKVLSRKLSSVMPSVHGERMAECADWVSVRTFPNGYQRIARAEFCRVRGCPACDACDRVKTTRKVTVAIKRHRKLNPLSGLIILKTEPKNCGVASLKSTIQGLSACMERAYQRKGFPPNWIRLTSVKVCGAAFSVSNTFILLASPGEFSGRGYLNTGEWSKLLGCAVEKTRHQYKGKKYMEPVVAAIKDSYLDFLATPSEIVPELVDSIKKQRLRSFSKEFSKLASAKEKEAKSGNSSHTLRTRTDYSVFVPDVLSHEYETELYLQIEEFSCE
jgi:Replication protein